MEWDDFKENVESWAEERGIYEHSTPQAQLLKALSELGELADAVIKNDREGLADAIGDVAVCLVNYAKMESAEIQGKRVEVRITPMDTAVFVGAIATEIGKALTKSTIQLHLGWVMTQLHRIVEMEKLTFTECLNQAWNEIKDRQGHMTPGGAFVKLA